MMPPETATTFDPNLTERHAGRFIMEGFEQDGVAWECVGDCQNMHVGCWRDAIIERYGRRKVSDLLTDETGVVYFHHAPDLDWNLLADDLNITQSGPSGSSSSSSSGSSDRRHEKSTAIDPNLLSVD